jgi:hypothetical protein
LKGDIQMNTRKPLFALLVLVFCLCRCAKPVGVPITEMNSDVLLGTWKGTGVVWSGLKAGQMTNVTMNILTVEPVRAKIFMHGMPQGTVIYGFRGKIADGNIVGQLEGAFNLALKLGLHEKEDGRFELRGAYSFFRRQVLVHGDLQLVKIPKE